LRGCFPGLGKRVPNEVQTLLEQRYVQCIGTDETAIWPGEPRQPECGQVTIAYLGEGAIPAGDPVERVICFQAEVRNPYWTTLGGTRHEINWKERTVFKVAVLQDGVWQVGPDEDQADRVLWERYACPEPGE